MGTPPPRSGGNTVVGQGGNRCLDMKHGAAADATVVQLRDCDSRCGTRPNRVWSIR
ncbi:hypothetical protein [Streptomyces sp. NPDC099088]|uniref:hypothetical protein n=1 Tax=Streptomyces sp. NPDC099088 TaxID=3366101 RepID=UPI003821EF33